MIPRDVPALRFEFIKELEALKQKHMDSLESDMRALMESARPMPAAPPKRARRRSAASGNGHDTTHATPDTPVDPLTDYTVKQAAPYLKMVPGTLRSKLSEEPNFIKYNKRPNGRVYILGSELLKCMAARGITTPLAQ